MVPKLIVPGLLVTNIALTISAAIACGDKLMLLAGGGRFRQVYARTHPASILAYVRPNSAVPGVVRELELQRTLQQTGYTFFAVQDAPRLDEALKTGKYDVLLIDIADVEGLEQRLSARSMPLVLPVVYKATKDDATTIQKRFHCILKAPGSADRYLAALDQAMMTRLKGSNLKVKR